MADGKRYYICDYTGEIKRAFCRLSAYFYFKADGKHYGYTCRLKDVNRYYKQTER